MHKNKLLQNNKQTSTLITSYLETPLGTMLAIVDDTHLYMLKFTDQSNLKKAIEQLQKITNSTIIKDSNRLIVSIQRELDAYFNGTLQKFSIPLQLFGTDFQQKSWHALTQIPYGYTTSYGQQAIVVGNAKAYRAVANANRNNPIAIIVPCHRIIKSNGDLCGYNGGIYRKQALLQLERNVNKSFCSR
jgi:AraC family transcriptional regulator, regulatory protein of adaptative response / methylated-DNA-[protein]-cysteine methyltransferase